MITVNLSIDEAGALESLLWEVIHETDEDLRVLREDLPETAIWRKINAAISGNTDRGENNG